MVAPISGISIDALHSAERSTAQRSRQTEPAAEAAGFGQSISDALSSVAAGDAEVAEAAKAAATGELQSINDYMIAATRAQLTTEITVAVRDRAVSAFTDIMRMQV